MNVHRILAPIDFSEGSRRAVGYALELGRRYAAPVDLFFVYSPEAYVVPEIGGGVASSVPYASEVSSEAAWKQDLDAFKKTLDSRGVALEGIVKCGHPAEMIVSTAEQGDYDLIVMGTHGRTGLQHVLMGSVAERVVRHAHCPVLTVPIQARRKES